MEQLGRRGARGKTEFPRSDEMPRLGYFGFPHWTGFFSREKNSHVWDSLSVNKCVDSCIAHQCPAKTSSSGWSSWKFYAFWRGRVIPANCPGVLPPNLRLWWGPVIKYSSIPSFDTKNPINQLFAYLGLQRNHRIRMPPTSIDDSQMTGGWRPSLSKTIPSKLADSELSFTWCQFLRIHQKIQEIQFQHSSHWGLDYSSIPVLDWCASFVRCWLFHSAGFELVRLKE